MAPKVGEIKYCNLYKFIKTHKDYKKLYEVIDDLCAKSLFKIGPNFKTTFLMPNDKLISKMLSDISEGHPEKAYDMLKGLLLKGVLASKADFKGDISNSLGFKLDEPSKLKIEHNKLFKTWEGRDNVVVYDLLEDNVPSAKTKSEWKPPMRTKKGGSADKRKELTKELANNFKKKSSVSPYACKIGSLLTFLKMKHMDIYDAVCFLLSGNSMVTWYVIIEPGKTSNQVISDEIFNEWQKSNMPQNKTYDAYLSGIEHAASKLHPKHFNNVNEIRKKLLTTSCNKIELPKSVLNEYKTFINKHKEMLPVHLVKLYEHDEHLKPFQDELQFFYPDACAYDINELDMINWTQTSKSLKIIDQSASNSKELFFSGIVSFVRSISFLYMPLSEEKHDKLIKIKNGGSSDPRSSQGIIYHSKGREQMKWSKKSGGADDDKPKHDFIMMAYMELDDDEQKALLEKLAAKKSE